MAMVCCFVAAAAAQQAGYLPPNKGYNYEPPRVPFSGNQVSTQVPYPTPRPPPVHHDVPHHEHHDDHHHHEPGMPFDFNYAVKEPEYGNDYSHNAISDGDVTRGEYRVQLPDGRLQIVRYTADWKEGFKAEVSYEGEARYPDPPQGNKVNQAFASPPSGGYKY